jgi:hypothetical protein
MQGETGTAVATRAVATSNLRPDRIVLICVAQIKCDECPNQAFPAISDAVISSHLRVRTSSQRGAAMKASSRASTHFSLMERILRATRAVAQYLVPHDSESETQAMLTAVIDDELTPI